MSLSGETTKINVSILANELEVPELEKYSKYCMTVRALTGEGYGGEGDEVCALTAEDGENGEKMFFFFLKMYHLTHEG